MSDKKHLNKSMVEFVLDKPTPSALNRYGIVDFYKDVIKYANALSQTPRLCHFIPCDENDVPIYDPCQKNKYCADFCQGRCQEDYNEACDRVLFDGITQENGLVFLPNKQVLDKSKLGKITFERILIDNLPLTEAGVKFFGYE